jgi:enoyl-CoA hydratase/carnithine racemase
LKYSHLDFVGDIDRVTLDHSAGNRINFAMRAELIDTFERVAQSEAKAVIVRAEGPDFCLGGDVRMTRHSGRRASPAHRGLREGS